jgi:hypothetical protein
VRLMDLLRAEATCKLHHITSYQREEMLSIPILH